MAEDRMALLETVRKAIADGDVDFLREGVRVLAEAVMEAEVTELTGVPQGERDPERRLTHRNGYRERRWDTRVGTVELSIPRVRDGSYFPSLLEPRRRAERALLAVVQEAYVPGRLHAAGRRPRRGPRHRRASARARSAASAPRSTPRSRPSATAPLAGEAVPLPLARRHLREGARGRPGRDDGGARGDRRRDDRVSAGCSGSSSPPGNDEGGAWPGFVRGARRARPRGCPARHQRRPPGPRQGRPRAAPRVPSWQRCRVHFTRNAQDLVPRSARSMVATVIRSIFEQPDEAAAREQLRRAVDGLEPPLPGGRRAADRGRGRPARPLHLPRHAPPPGSAAPTRSSG